MPICSDPQATAEFWLKVDENKPASERPVFVCRFLTARQIREVRRLVKSAYEEKDDAEAAALLDKSLAIGIVGWRNYPGEFSIERIADVLSESEQWELAWSWPLAVSVAEKDRKGSASPSPSVGDRSAATVAAASASTSLTK